MVPEVIGRLISPAALATLYRNFGQKDAPALSTAQAWTDVVAGRVVLQLADELQLRRVRVMGLFSEIIAWRLHFFMPVGASDSDVLGRLLERHPLTTVIDHPAA